MKVSTQRIIKRLEISHQNCVYLEMKSVCCLSFPSLAKKPTFELGILQNLYIENVWWCQECQQQQFYPPIKLLLLLQVLPLLAFLFSSFLHSLSSLQAGSSLQFTAFAIAQLLAGSTMHCIVMGLHTRENV